MKDLIWIKKKCFLWLDQWCGAPVSKHWTAGSNPSATITINFFSLFHNSLRRSLETDFRLRKEPLPETLFLTKRSLLVETSLTENSFVLSQVFSVPVIFSYILYVLRFFVSIINVLLSSNIVILIKTWISQMINFLEYHVKYPKITIFECVFNK